MFLFKSALGRMSRGPYLIGMKRFSFPVSSWRLRLSTRSISICALGSPGLASPSISSWRRVATSIGPVATTAIFAPSWVWRT
jgi:hypothetical protein